MSEPKEPFMIHGQYAHYARPVQPNPLAEASQNLDEEFFVKNAEDFITLARGGGLHESTIKKISKIEDALEREMIDVLQQQTLLAREMKDCSDAGNPAHEEKIKSLDLEYKALQEKRKKIQAILAAHYEFKGKKAQAEANDEANDEAEPSIYRQFIAADPSNKPHPRLGFARHHVPLMDIPQTSASDSWSELQKLLAEVVVRFADKGIDLMEKKSNQPPTPSLEERMMSVIAQACETMRNIKRDEYQHESSETEAWRSFVWKMLERQDQREAMTQANHVTEIGLHREREARLMAKLEEIQATLIESALKK